MKRFTILFVFLLCCLAVQAQRQSREGVVRALTSGCENVPLPYHIGVKMKPSSVALNQYRDSAYIDIFGARVYDKVEIKNYKPALYGDQFIFPVWQNIQLRKRLRPKPNVLGEDNDNGEDNYANVKFPYDRNAHYIMIDAVSIVACYETHMLLTLDMKGRIIDKLEVGNFLESIAVREATVDTNQIITVYTLNVLNCKSIEIPLDGQIAFRARRTDTRYMVTPKGRFRKLDRVIYKSQPYTYNMDQIDSITMYYKNFHITDGNEVVGRTVQYRK